ncbi:hypothetical protein YH65_01590 [Sulfurovum lithotrophicum]|uniref:Plasminogen-binding protein PgbA N-terminal domain-containing protein n=1 Tax=Sulfurovum lithotrophicum TaxID=206403 RepID=A0A7U4RQ07_9BACT|nr:plasminogen-binding N-terminal domain-containing protein [Sulfurovum lithotrophicum]AKF24232.1 hypothetical protein YH65_01590 [Sulfurovum lithotrophicum]
MIKIALILLTALPLFAGFFPSTVHTSVSVAKGDTIALRSSFPANGMSGIIVHNYGSDLQAITAYIAQTSKGHAKVISKDIIHHDKLPTIKTPVRAGDKVIGGYLYNNVLLLAPDADTYAKVTSSYTKNWIHPDLFAIYLSKRGDAFPTRENLSSFAKDYQIGLICIVRKNSLVLLDPISGRIINKKAMGNLPAKAQFPFYMHFNEIRTGWFSKSSTGSYYQTMEAL